MTEPEDLLAHAGWLRRLAVSLVGAQGGADDLVQDTWLAALRRPPRRDAPLRPWLAQVLRNLVRMRARHGGVVAATRPEVEEAERARGAPSPDMLLGRLETERLLARLVAELDEPYRQTILLRYHEGLSSAEIARAQKLPAATVRSRLKTGIDRLRGELDAAHRGDRKKWHLALAPLAASRLSLVGKGIVVMTRTQKLGAGAALLLALLALLGVAWKRLHTEPAVATTPTPAAAPPAAPAPAPPPAAAPAAAPSGPVALSPADLMAATGATVVREPALALGGFAGRVLNFSTGEPIANAQVTFSADDDTLAVVTDAQGRFEANPSRPGRYTLAVVTAPDTLPFAPEWDHSPIALTARPGLRIRDITIYLRPAIDYTGVVLAPDGKVVAGAKITLLGASAGEQASSPIADHFTSDAAGEFVFHAPDLALLEARHPKYGPGRARLDGPVQVSHRMEIKLTVKKGDDKLGTAGYRGVVVDDTGKPVTAALVHAEPLAEGAEDALHPWAEARTGNDGRFTLQGLDPGEHELTAACLDCPIAKAKAMTGTEVKLVMAAGGTISGKVLDAGGAPVPSFSVVVTRAKGVAETALTEATVIDAEGQFQISGLPPGEARVRANASGHAPSQPANVRIGGPGDEPTEVTLTLPRGGSLKGLVKERDTGIALPWARISIDGGYGGGGSSAVPLLATTVTDDKGEFVLSGVAAGARSVFVAAGGHHMRIISGLQFEEGGMLGPLVVELTALKEGEEPTVEMFGVGAALHGDNDALVVDKVFPGGGAAAAGLVPGDAIVGIDGMAVAQIGFQDSIQRIRGPESSRVRLAVRRAGNVAEIVVERRRVVF